MEAVDSALAQSFPDIEVVVVDDGNEQEEKTTIERVVIARRGVRLIQLPANTGLATARNAGINSARGKWIVPLDADDTIEPEFIEAMLAGIEMDPRRFAYPDSTLWWEGSDKTQRLVAHDYDFTELLQRVTWPCTILYAKDAWRQVGGYKSVMSQSGGWEDWEFAIALGEIGVCGVHVNRPLFRYRQHSADQMRFHAEKNRDRLRETIRRLHEAVYRGERMAGCCGGGARTPQTSRAGAPVSGSARAQKTSSNGATDGTVLVRYVGAAVGARTWVGSSGFPYRFGMSQPLQRVRQVDADMFLTLPEFQKVEE
jgi:glycosyltransferase involved in cell wall biosynthesis